MPSSISSALASNIKEEQIQHKKQNKTPTCTITITLSLRSPSTFTHDPSNFVAVGKVKMKRKDTVVSLNPNNHSNAFLAKGAAEQLPRNTISIRSLQLNLYKATTHDQRLSCKTQRCPICLLFILRRILPLTTDHPQASNVISIEMHPETQTQKVYVPVLSAWTMWKTYPAF